MGSLLSNILCIGAFPKSTKHKHTLGLPSNPALLCVKTHIQHSVQTHVPSETRGVRAYCVGLASLVAAKGLDVPPCYGSMQSKPGAALC